MPECDNILRDYLHPHHGVFILRTGDGHHDGRGDRDGARNEQRDSEHERAPHQRGQQHSRRAHRALQ